MSFLSFTRVANRQAGNAALGAIAASTAVALAALLPLRATAEPSPPPARTLCDASTTTTAIGLDTAAGRALLSLPAHGAGADAQPARLIEIDAAGETARAWNDTANGRFGGSVGPGPVLGVLPCPGSCLQPVRFVDGAFQPLGETLSAPQGATVAATYDAEGAPWIVLLTGAAGGDLRAWAYRFEGKREWQEHGSQVLTAVGELPANPAPGVADGIVVGTGIFRASAPPALWVEGLPALPAERRGQLIALSPRDAAYLASDGAVYASADAGKTWRRSTWTPWGQGTTGLWRQGTDYWVDLPLGERRGALQLAWFDRRVASNERLVLSRRDPGGAWVVLAEAPSALHGPGGESLDVSDVLLPKEGRWLVISGCAAAPAGAVLPVRTFDGHKLSEPRFVPIELVPLELVPNEPVAH
ncbi:MAG TPA: hypothetical protein VN783_08460 [Thermoanaerobaculia bacterium]|nr:hypothetical protein [Thermoanaerobaculia bacterium]